MQITIPALQTDTRPAVLSRLAAMIVLTISVLFATSLTATPLRAQDAAIQSTISGQLQAFNRDDVETAFGLASPMIQGLFGTAENFGLMVRTGYPMVWRNDDVRFLELRDIRGDLHQKVMIRDARGGLHILDYKMIETSEGWRIDGVSLLPAPDVGA